MDIFEQLLDHLEGLKEEGVRSLRFSRPLSLGGLPVVEEARGGGPELLMQVCGLAGGGALEQHLVVVGEGALFGAGADVLDRIVRAAGLVRLREPKGWDVGLVRGRKVVLLSFGQPAFCALTGEQRSVPRGQWHRVEDLALMPTYDPRLLDSDLGAKQQTWADVLAVVEYLGLPRPSSG